MRRPGSLPHAVMTEIQQLFTDEGQKVGDRLPSERDLAKQLSVGRSSLREAIQGLETMGLVQRRHGVGTFFVAEPGSWCTKSGRGRDAGPSARIAEGFFVDR